MAEWSIAAVLKTVDPHGSGGSNPSLSAALCKTIRISKFQTHFADFCFLNTASNRRHHKKPPSSQSRFSAFMFCKKLFQNSEKLAIVHWSVLVHFLLYFRILFCFSVSPWRIIRRCGESVRIVLFAGHICPSRWHNAWQRWLNTRFCF